MTQVYLNGSAPDYFGFTFSTAAALIDQIETTLVSAGWTSLAKVSGTSLFLRGVAEDGGTAHNCWVEFTVTGTSPNLLLNLQGWLEEAKTNGSGALPLREDTSYFSFIDSTTNRLWLSADSGSLGMCIINSNGRGNGMFFGFCDRILGTDEFGIYIGEISCRTYNTCRVAKLWYAPTNLWFLIGTGFANGADAGNASTNTNRGGLHLDFMSNAFYNSAVAPSSPNPVMMPASPIPSTEYMCHGRINALTGKPLIANFGLIEGENSNSYNTNILNPDNFERYEQTVAFRGWIKHAVTGLAGERTGYQFVAADGSRYLSVGPGWGFQGLQIKGAD